MQGRKGNIYNQRQSLRSQNYPEQELCAFQRLLPCSRVPVLYLQPPLSNLWPVALLQKTTLLGVGLQPSRGLNTAPTSTRPSWCEIPKSNVQKKKKNSWGEQVIVDEWINRWDSLKWPRTNSDLCGAPTGPSWVWCLFNKHLTAERSFVGIEKGWNVFELQAMTECCHQTSAHSQRHWKLTTTNRLGSMCCGGCIWDSFAANHLFFCLFARQFRDGIIFEENRTRTTADECR